MPNWLKWTLLGCFGVLLLGCGGCFILARNLGSMFTETVQAHEGFLKAIEANNAQQGFDLMSADLKAKKPIAKFKNEVTAINTKYGKISSHTLMQGGQQQKNPQDLSGIAEMPFTYMMRAEKGNFEIEVTAKKQSDGSYKITDYRVNPNSAPGSNPVPSGTGSGKPTGTKKPQ